MGDSVEELVMGIEDGDAGSFIKLIDFAERNYGKMLYTMGFVDIDGYMLIKSCTYILIDRFNGVAYALVNDGKPKVASFEVDGEDVAAVVNEVCGGDED
ncbi:MAG: hypothetical protein RXR44_06660 [Vulcanisaeta sp.]